MNNSALKILVCYHKPYTMPPNNDGILLPIQVGKALTETDLHIQADNELNGQHCDNISDKNATYNELTAMYWAWKNIKKLYPDVKYIGLYHYRRFFAFDEQKFFAPDINKPEEAIMNYSLDAEKIIRILESGRLILAKRSVFPSTAATQYCICHVSDDYRTLKNIIREKYPDYYDAFLDVMERNNKLSPFNMFIMKYDDFVKYCEWIFGILPLIEPEIQKNSNTYQRRLFISERLLNVYIHKYHMKAKYLNVYNYGSHSENKSLVRKIFSCTYRFIAQSKYNFIMLLVNFSFDSFIRKLKKFPLKH